MAVIFWYTLNNLFLWREGRILPDFIYTLISFSLFFIFSVIYLLLVDDRKIVMLSSFFINFSFLVFFLRADGIWVSLPAIISYIILTFVLFGIYNLTNKNILYDRKNSIVFHPARSALKAGPALLIVFALLLSVLFYFNFPLMDKEGKIEIKEPLLEKLTKPFGGAINRYIPIYDMDMRVDEFIVLTSIIGLPFARSEEEGEMRPPVDIEETSEEIINYLNSKGIYDLEEINFIEYLREDEEFRALFIEEIKKLTSQTNPYLMNKYRKNLSENWGIEINSEDRMGEVFTTLANSRINQVPENIRNLILIFPSIILFGILEVVFLVLNFIYSFICWVLLIVFYKSKFYHFRKIKVEKEEIEL